MCTIVIVEDEELERQALREILTRGIPGCTILGEAGTGQQAIELIDKGGIDLMLVDINIPRPNGLEVLRHLRSKNSETRVIITTAHDNFDMAREAIRLKTDEYLLKPVRPNVLIDTVQACLNICPDQCRELMDLIKRLGILLAQDMYREGVMLVRGRVNCLFAQEGGPSTQQMQDFADALAHLARDKSLNEAGVRAIAGRLRGVKPDARNRQKIMTLFLDMADGLFASAGAQFGHTPDPMQKALNFIERNLYKGATLEETAEHAHVSACYLSRLFKKSLNINFITYLTQRRMELAKDMLQNSDTPVNAIALDLSYNDVNYFCKSFKKEVGMSPSEYRRQSRTTV